MPIASGINKIITVKKETSWGVAAGATGGQSLRRTEATFDLTKSTFQSSELRPSQQKADFRHGGRKVEGSINGELSPGSYQLLIDALLRRDSTGAILSAAATNVTATAGPPGTFQRAAGSYLTDGFRIGHVFRWTGWAAGATANNARNYRIVDLSANGQTMTVTGVGAETVAAKAAGDSVTATLVGKQTFVPAAGQLATSFTVECWYPDVGVSEVFLGCRVASADISISPTGMATIRFNLMGKNMTTGVAQYFTTPAAPLSTGVLAGPNGTLRVGASDIATVTSLNIRINGNLTGDEVLGSLETPELWQGEVMVDGSLSAYFDGISLRDAFLNETELALHVMLTTSNAVNADFLAITLPRIKLGGAQKDDGNKGLKQNVPFTALENTSSALYQPTTIMWQDSTI